MTELTLSVIPGSCKKISITLDNNEGELSTVLQGFNDLEHVEEVLHRLMSMLAELSDERPEALAVSYTHLRAHET